MKTNPQLEGIIWQGQHNDPFEEILSKYRSNTEKIEELRKGLQELYKSYNQLITPGVQP